ncbi:MAG: VOC family protein [Azospirillaceae bacterium]
MITSSSIQAVITTLPSSDLAATKAFYAKLGFTPVMDGPGYLQLRLEGRPDVQIGFFQAVPDHPLGMFRATATEGLILTVAVENLDASLARVRDDGRELAVEMRQEPWGQRHFAMADPNGVIIDVMQDMAEEAEAAA